MLWCAYDLYLKEKFPRGKNETYQFEVTKGDVLSNPRKQQTSAKKLVGEILEGFMKKSKFRPSDIVHIIDIDGIMASSDDIVIDESLENNHEYDLVNNKVKFKKLSLYEKTKEIWDKKKANIKVLSRTTEISKKRYKLKYDLLFFH
ncbi:hypothetical protein FC36_GL001454 [Ligilactobacillus equi DSM 15833 = JCM 10991]|uniref:Uncharacterized protein n=1 Tax=Ligilactobacillus equi DSM 15833 = JCM 10991 TaxID=1423740 RepID=A0A0R1TFD2_9LACO|nr:hypothetical protein FC36_GL001454 [Ligilactobacillus equi DSM 15833 = JCM 10991]